MNGEYASVVFSGALIHGQYIQSGTVYPFPTGAALASGNVQSGHVASGSVPGYFGPTRAIQSGTVGSFDFGSGAVMAGQIGSGAVQSGNIASGQIDRFHLSSGIVGSGTLVSGSVNSGNIAAGAVRGGAAGLNAIFNIASGTVVASDIGSGAIQSGHIASGQVGHGHFASGAITSGHKFANASVFGQQGIFSVNVPIASGTISSRDLAEGAVQSGTIFAGCISNVHLNSGAVTSGRLAVTGTPDGTKFLRDDLSWQVPLASGAQIIPGQVIKWCNTTELISGQRAVMWASGGYPRIKRADPRSGQYTPVVGVTLSGGVSGASVAVVVHGPVNWAASGMMASGFHGDPVFAGSGGTVVMASGTHAGGTSSGGGIKTLSGMVACGVGTIHSGMVYVSPDQTIVSQSGQTIARRGFVF